MAMTVPAISSFFVCRKGNGFLSLESWNLSYALFKRNVIVGRDGIFMAKGFPNIFKFITSNQMIHYLFVQKSYNFVS